MSRENVLTHEDTEKLSLALATENLPAIRSIFAKLPPNREEWSLSDRGLVSQAFAMEIIKGHECKPTVMDYLVSLHPGVEWEYIDRNTRFPHRSENAYLCGNYLRNFYSFALGSDPAIEKYPSLREDRIESAIRGTTNAFVKYVNGNLGSPSVNTIPDLEVFLEWFQFAAPYGKQACAESATSKGCLALGLYKRTAGQMTEKLNVNKAPYEMKLKEIQAFLDSQ